MKNCSRWWANFDVCQSKKVKNNCSIPWVNLACILYTYIFRKQPPRCSVKKAVHNNFAIFTIKHLCWSLFLIRSEGLRLQHRYFPMINTKFSRTPILKDTCKRLFLKIYPVLLFWFLEGIAEVANCRRSTEYCIST